MPKATQPKDQQPDSFDHDLHPNINAGVNDVTVGANPELDAITAYDMKEIHDLLPNFNDDELKRIVIMPEGSVLKQGATYLDLRHAGRGEIKVERPEQVGPPNLNLFIPKTETDYEAWNKLRGITDPERI
jgi:hypothetical protein